MVPDIASRCGELVAYALLLSGNKWIRYTMTDKSVWFVTGAGRGLGVDLAKAALGAGHAVVATGRNAAAVARAVGAHDDLHIVTLDVTSENEATAAVASAIKRFGHIDVLVNNAG